MKKKNLSDKQIALKRSNLPFTEYYNSLPNPRNALNPRTHLLKAISSITGKSVCSVRKWALGTTNPSPMEKDAIAALLNNEVETLFPN